jgi:hypothetical protein
MRTHGTFGYIIGKKKRMIYVENDADLLWQILVREIYILMKHYTTKEALQKAFETIQPIKTKTNPKQEAIEKCKIFTDFEEHMKTPTDEWSSILKYCQSSYINILEAGYIINQPTEIGDIFMLDFNKGIAKFYNKDVTGKTKELKTSTIEEIMDFDEMPTKSYTVIVTEMKTQFEEFYVKYVKVQEEIDKINVIITQAKIQCSYNIQEKAKQLLDKMVWERKKLIKGRRVFYTRLHALDLIDETN